MDARLLIDQIVRQTTVLLAQLSTAAGIRAPMAHIADQVFLNLAREIEQQGVGRKVAADMFGMALRTYQRRVQRVSESASARDRTLWEAVLDYLGAGSRARKDILHRFRWDGEASVAAVLNDLTNSGILYCVGRGEHAVYGLTSEADLQLLAQGQEQGALEALLQVHIYRQGHARVQDMAQIFCLDQARIQQVLEEMVQEGRLQPGEEPGLYTAQTFLVPVGAEMGWEAAVYDHYQAMAKAVAHKLQTLGARSRRDDRIGGATLSFDIHEDHPQAEEVLGLLQRVRAEVNEIWDRVVAAQELEPVPEHKKIKVTFYFGQNIEAFGAEDLEEALEPQEHPSPEEEP